MSLDAKSDGGDALVNVPAIFKNRDSMKLLTGKRINNRRARYVLFLSGFLIRFLNGKYLVFINSICLCVKPLFSVIRKLFLRIHNIDRTRDLTISRTGTFATILGVRLFIP